MTTPELATNSQMRGIAGILLAAGSSRRFGRDKQAALIDGQPLLVRAARTLLDAGFLSPVVVLDSGPRASLHRSLLAGLAVRLVENPAASTGMASSLRLGLETALAAPGPWDAVVVTVCDQPAVTAAHLVALVQRWRQGGATLVASAYGEARGVPALIAAPHFPELLQLQGDHGAGPLLARYPDRVALLPLPGGALDLDTPEDLALYTRQHRARQ